MQRELSTESSWLALSIGEELVASDGKPVGSCMEREVGSERLLVGSSIGKYLITSDGQFLVASIGE